MRFNSSFGNADNLDISARGFFFAFGNPFEEIPLKMSIDVLKYAVSVINVLPMVTIFFTQQKDH